MPAYIQGNLAVERKPTQTVKVKETKKVVYRNKSLPFQEKLIYLFTVLLCVVVAGVIIWRYAQIYQINADIQKMQQEVRQIQAENSALKQEVEKLQSPERMKQKAKEFGMVPMEERQVSQVAPSKNSKASGSNDKITLNP
jgi:cell division protein FtsL